MNKGRRILVVDDDERVVRGVTGLLEDEGFRTTTARNAAEAWTLLSSGEVPALMLLDVRMPGESGIELLRRLPRPLAMPVVVLSGEASAADAAEALKLGAVDFVEKPPTPERLLTTVRNALKLADLADERERLREELSRPGALVGSSPALDELRRLVVRVAKSEAAVLVTGETGCGKERVARALHFASGRRGRFVAVNCAAIPATLLEGELFGYERGAFTGAARRHLGRMEQADGGTLLLDEIGDMPLELQAKLLRVLETKEVERLGGTGPVKTDVRFIAATHRPLAELVRDRRFRADLFYRLDVCRLQVPPLRERADDVLPLLHAFASELLPLDVPVEVAPEAQKRLRAYAWPGNVRELRNLVERLVLFRGEGPLVIGAGDVAQLGPAHAPAAPRTPGDRGYRELVEEFERELIERALSASDRNIAAAARLLKLDRAQLWRRMQALGLNGA